MGPFDPKENVRPPARTEKPGRESGIGGTGISGIGRLNDFGSDVIGMSVEEGRVEVELCRAEEAELS